MDWTARYADPDVWYLVLIVILSVALIVIGLALLWKSFSLNRFKLAVPSVALVILGFVGLGIFGPVDLDLFHGKFGIHPAGEDSAMARLVQSLHTGPLSSKEITDLRRTNPKGIDGWMGALLYRIEIRNALKELCAKVVCASTVDRLSDPSFTRLINELAQKGVIDANQTSKLCEIRDDTHYLEWRTWKAPDEADIKTLAKNEPEMLDSMIKLGSLPIAQANSGGGCSHLGD